MDPIFPYIYSLIQILGGGARDDDDDRMLMERITKSFPTRGVSHYGLAIYIKKYLKPKEELWKTQTFHHAKIYQSSKNPLKETKILQGIRTLLELISRFNTSQNIIFQKSSYKNRPIIIIIT
jgi:hypothetical protein